jgi:exopolysaccharide production protein ExoZ
MIIRPIQYLRAIAALMVVWFHSSGQVPGTSQFEIGASGVDLFFVISGFIMWVTTAGKDVAAGEFIQHRIVRVAPMYWLITLLMLACAILEPGLFRSLKHSGTAVVKSLLFVPYDSLSFPGHAWPLLVPGWSLNYEMFFYALFAASLLVPARIRLATFLAVMGALVLAGFITQPTDPILATYTGPKLIEFAAGAAIGHFWIRGMFSVNWWLSIALIVMGFWLLLFMEGKLPDWSQMLGATLIVCGSLNPALSDLRSRILLALGDASYSIYLTHLFTLGVLRAVWTRMMPPGPIAAVAFMAVALTVCAGMGWICYRFVEKPLTSWLRGMARKRGPIDTATLTAPAAAV